MPAPPTKSFITKSFRVTKPFGNKINRTWRASEAKSFSDWITSLVEKEIKRAKSGEN